MAARAWASEGIAPGDPCLNGHFPGNPIVPGAVLLGEMAARLAAEGWQMTALLRVKFLSPLAPATPFEMTASAVPGRARLRWTARGVAVAEAVAEIAPLDG